MFDKDAIKKDMLKLAEQFEGHPVDYDAKDGPQCADFSAFLIKNTTGKTIWGNAIETDNKENINIINENPNVEAKHVDPHEIAEGDLLVESNSNPKVGHVSLIDKIHDDGTVTVYEQNLDGDATGPNPLGVQKHTRKLADFDGWGRVMGALRIEAIPEEKQWVRNPNSRRNGQLQRAGSRQGGAYSSITSLYEQLGMTFK
ncbi:endolysin (endogenous virus) [Lactococcus phage KSY1]|uniref:Gp053a n=1 Tax=Lactococcus phage KSY1 TaxID=2913972 RepID=A6MAB7_9CAUD|nr:endolysin [Lactococcus phage KSY1]ABG21595.1 gp053a [Lactococcus phage KSY1]